MTTNLHPKATAFRLILMLTILYLGLFILSVATITIGAIVINCFVYGIRDIFPLSPMPGILFIVVLYIGMIAYMELDHKN